MTSFLRDGVIPCFCRNTFCLSISSQSGIYVVTSLSPVKGCKVQCMVLTGFGNGTKFNTDPDCPGRRIERVQENDLTLKN